MLNVLAITFPIFFLIAVGFVMVRLNIVSQAGIPFLGRFVMYFALPALIFKALAQRSFGEIMNLPYLLAYAAGSLTMLFVGYAFARYRQRKDAAHSTLFGMGMAFSNSGFVGYPILLQLLGPAATVALALTMIVENMLMMPLAIAMADRGGQQHGGRFAGLLATLRGLLKHPIIIAILLGLTCATLQIPLAAPLLKVVDMAAAASGAVALFVIGGALVGLKLKGLYRDISLIVVGKLIGHPLAVLVALWLLPPFDPLLQVAAVAAACSPMLSIYPIFGQKYGMEGLCAAALLAGTVSAFFTISAAIWLFGATDFIHHGIAAWSF